MTSLKHVINSVLSRSTGYVITKSPSKAGTPSAPQRTPSAAKPSGRTGRPKPGRPSQASFDAVLSRLSGIPTEQLSLTDIANRHGSDKGSIGVSVDWAGHNYTDVYEAMFSPMRDQPINLLEVGMGVPGENWEARIAHGRNTGGGASIKTWYDYFPHAQIMGADINPAPHLDNDRTTTYVVDQGDPQSLQDFLGKIGDVEFDIIVDDGSHRPDHQQLTLGFLFGKVKPGGLYIIEDLLNNGIGGSRTDRMSSSDVLSTRRSLKQWRQDGTFAEPHQVHEVERVLDEVADITFHVPRNPWRASTESVVVLRKKG